MLWSGHATRTGSHADIAHLHLWPGTRHLMRSAIRCQSATGGGLLCRGLRFLTNLSASAKARHANDHGRPSGRKYSLAESRPPQLCVCSVTICTSSSEKPRARSRSTSAASATLDASGPRVEHRFRREEAADRHAIDAAGQVRRPATLRRCGRSPCRATARRRSIMSAGDPGAFGPDRHSHA